MARASRYGSGHVGPSCSDSSRPAVRARLVGDARARRGAARRRRGGERGAVRGGLRPVRVHAGAAVLSRRRRPRPADARHGSGARVLPHAVGLDGVRRAVRRPPARGVGGRPRGRRGVAGVRRRAAPGRPRRPGGDGRRRRDGAAGRAPVRPRARLGGDRGARRSSRCRRRRRHLPARAHRDRRALVRRHPAGADGRSHRLVCVTCSPRSRPGRSTPTRRRAAARGSRRGS